MTRKATTRKADSKRTAVNRDLNAKSKATGIKGGAVDAFKYKPV